MKTVIVGAGLAGHTAAIELRKLSSEASVTLLGSEAGLPYDRPPLSKDLLLGQVGPEGLVLPEALDYARLGVEYRPATTAVEIDRAGRQVVTADGGAFDYDRLLLATGSRPRLLPVAIASSRLFYLRSIEDAVAMRTVLRPEARLVVIGGGFIGLEVAAAARQAGSEVTVVEAQDRLLSRGMPRFVGRTIAAIHKNHGVEVLLGCSVEGVRMRGPDALLVDTSLGTLHADAVVVGIGVEPNVELAVRAGLATENGIVVDEACRTSDPLVFAAGEVTAHKTWGGTRRRLESWKVAADQPLVAARAMLDLPAIYAAVPWLWSDQFGKNLQFLGATDHAAGYWLQGRLNADQWTIVAVDADGAPIGAIAMNNGRQISMVRRAIENSAALSEAFLAGAVRLQPSALDGLLDERQHENFAGRRMAGSGGS
ncbi:MAG: FAD-dependent oxidoreductase [Rhizobiaceae bacterium]|nr:FAD-dependent oxidoreductase [Rhizobiaceae bacterium]